MRSAARPACHRRRRRAVPSARSSFGSAVNENAFLIDGTNFTCPCSGVSRAEPSVDVVQDVHVQSFGASVEKRRSLVQVAFSAQVESAEGRLYASLPTEHAIPIPLYINADFFPTNDRKRILLDHDYQGQWNRTAITCAAGLVGTSLGILCESLPMERFWGLLESLWQCRQLPVGADAVLRTFWERAQPAAVALPIVLSTIGMKRRATDIRLLQSVKDE